MSTDDLIKLILAIAGVLTIIGGGAKWVIGAFLAGLKENTAAITHAAAVQTEAINALRLELREHRVEIRTLIGLRSDSDSDDATSDDGQPAPLTPIHSVPTGHLQINRKAKP